VAPTEQHLCGHIAHRVALSRDDGADEWPVRHPLTIETRVERAFEEPDHLRAEVRAWGTSQVELQQHKKRALER
jgi:hypothetical protein